jgi:hypothetical protein
MSTNRDELELIALHEMGKSSPKVQDLINEKNKALIDLEKTETVRFKKLDPAPSPSNDKRMLRQHSHSPRTPEQTVAQQLQIEQSYDGQIKQAMMEKAVLEEHEYFLPTLQDMSNKEVGILAEKGPYAVLDMEKQQAMVQDQPAILDLDDESRFNRMALDQDFKENVKDLDIQKTPDPADDFE